MRPKVAVIGAGNVGATCAQRILERKLADVALVDIRMPGISGLDILNHQPQFPSRPSIFVITAQDTMENAVEAMRLGAFDYATKPFNLDEVALKDWEDFRVIRDPINREIERKREMKLIGSSLEAKIELAVEDQELRDFLGRIEKDLALALVVSQGRVVAKADGADWSFVSVTLPSDGKTRSFGIRVSQAEGEKCVRCWNFSTRVGENSEHPKLCQKCMDAVSGKKWGKKY